MSVCLGAIKKMQSIRLNRAQTLVSQRDQGLWQRLNICLQRAYVLERFRADTALIKIELHIYSHSMLRVTIRHASWAKLKSQQHLPINPHLKENYLTFQS